LSWLPAGGHPPAGENDSERSGGISPAGSRFFPVT